MIARALTLTFVLLLSACGSENATDPLPTETQAQTASKPAESPVTTTNDDTANLGDWGVETQYMNTSIDPGDDFYRYVNDGWLEVTELPTGFSRTSSFMVVQLETEEQVQALIDEILEKDWPAGSTEANAKALYQSYMNTERLDELGVEPIRPELEQIFAAGSHEDIIRFEAGPISPTTLNIGIALDDQNPDRYLPRVQQGSTRLPLDVYLKDVEPYKSLLAAYQAYLEKILTLAGIDRPAERAAEAVAFETRLAEASWTPTETRDKVRMYRLMSMDELAEFAPGYDWNLAFQSRGFGERESVVVRTDSAVQKQAAIFAETPVETLQSYMVAELITGNADMLSSDFDDAHFDYFSTTLQGIKEQRPRDKRAIQVLNAVLGEPLGKLYVERYFPESSKAEVERMIGYMQVALGERLDGLEWMDEDTRAEAHAKLDSFVVNIAYPDRWKDFSAFNFNSDDLFGNLRQFSQWALNDAVAKLDLPNQRWEWLTQPQVINAFYAAIYNSITFPAAVMQPPFFDPNADPAVNFGAIGVAIGHEIGHGFDDQGSQSDGDGVLRNWWSEESRAEFDRRTDEFVAQYDQYSPMEGVNVSGRLTLGENIGDLAGITMAYAAWKKYEAEHYEGGTAPVIDGFTGDQRFFLSFAQLWRNLATEQKIRELASQDNHSPGEFRTNGIVRNFDPWYEAFDVTEDNALYLPPEERVRIW